MRKISFRVWCCLFVFISLTGVSWGQTDLEKVQNAAWYEAAAGDGVVWKYYHFDDLFGGQQDVYVADGDLSVPGVEVKIPYGASCSRDVVSNFAAGVSQAKAAVNGNFIDITTPTYCSVQYLKVDSVLVATTAPGAADEGGFAVAGDGSVTVLSRPVAGWASLTEPTIMASNTNILQAGVQWPWPLFEPHYSFYYVDRHPRTALGKTLDDHILLVVVDGRRDDSEGVTYEQMAVIMQGLDVYDGIGLDGGGSSTMWVDGESVINVPSDGGQRMVGNAVVITGNAPTSTPDWDARVTSQSDTSLSITSEQSEAFSITFTNYGTETWNPGEVFLATSDPEAHASEFETTGEWISSSRIDGITSSVAQGGSVAFAFNLTAPAVVTATNYTESFGLIKSDGTPFGARQNRVTLTAVPENTSGEIIIESRSGGINNQWYTDSGMADSGTDCTAPGLTGTIGQRYGSTYQSVAGAKWARWTPDLAEAGEYDVYIAWGTPTSGSRNPITYKVYHSGGNNEYLQDQTLNGNTWIMLGTFTFNAGDTGYVEMSNEDIDVSGSMYAAAAKFVKVPTEVEGWSKQY